MEKDEFQQSNIGLLLLIWFNFNFKHGMGKSSRTNKVWDEITYPFSYFNGATVEVWEWISKFIPHFIMDVITYPCWDLS